MDQVILSVPSSDLILRTTHSRIRNCMSRTIVARFEVLMAMVVRMSMLVFWVATLCRLVGTCQRVGWTHCLQRQCWSADNAESMFVRYVGLPTSSHGFTTQKTKIDTYNCFYTASLVCPQIKYVSSNRYSPITVLGLTVCVLWLYSLSWCIVLSASLPCSHGLTLCCSETRANATRSVGTEDFREKWG
jgi:hypothetical protein